MNKKFPIDPVFWHGLPGHLRTVAWVIFFILIASMVSAGFAAWNGFYRLSVKILLVALVAGGITWWLIGDRIRAWWRDEGWRCEKCGERIGYSDAAEAFRLEGVLGDLIRDRAAYILCPQKHYTPIDWDTAWHAMRAELAVLTASATGKAEASRLKDDLASRTVSREEEAFADKANALIKQSDPGDYLYQSLNDIRQQLGNFSHRKWASLNREQLYRMLALLEAYDQVTEHRSLLGAPDDEGGYSLLPDRVFVEYIDSFGRVNNVTPDDVSSFLNEGYLDIPENDIKRALEDILKEPLRRKDYGGEENDIYTSNLIVGGRRTSAAFMLKGPAVRVKELRIKDCGDTGDQLVKLFQSPAEVFVVQYVGNFHLSVIKDVQGKTAERRGRGKPTSFCIINGQDTARLLYAYGKL